MICVWPGLGSTELGWLDSARLGSTVSARRSWAVWVRLGLNTLGPYPTLVRSARGGSPVCVVQAWEFAHLVGLLTVEFDEGGVDEARLSPRPDQRPCTLVRMADTLPGAANANAGVYGAARGGAPRVV